MIRNYNKDYPTEFNTVLFDFDGTILDTNEMVIKSWQHTFKTFLGHEMPMETIYSTFGEQLEATMQNLLPGVDVEAALRIYRNFQERECADLMKEYPGMFELSDRLRTSGYKTSIVTSRHWNEAGHIKEKFDVESHYDVLITEENCTKHKPDPEPVNLALKALNVRAEDAIMIGDSIHDIECAHNAGIPCILMSYSIAYPPEKVHKEGLSAPDYIVDSAEDVWELITGKSGR